jgi:preprotein translocase subunit SecE
MENRTTYRTLLEYISLVAAIIAAVLAILNIIDLYLLSRIGP